MNAGRYAPSPTGDLHLGNLRTALLAWAWARSTRRDFYLRLEDLDQDRARDPQSQIDDLQEIGIDWDGPIVVQSERHDLYEGALDHLRETGHLFECFCSRKDIREAASAAHTPPAAYPGPCATLTDAERTTRRRELAQQGRKPALRLRPDVDKWTVHDDVFGPYTGPVEQVVLQRGDGAYAYNLAAVVDDVAQGVDQVVRGDDLLESAPTQAYLTHLLGGTAPRYAHVPLVLGPQGKRLAKRDGAVTLCELRAEGHSTSDVLRALSASTGLPASSSATEFLRRFDPRQITPAPAIFVEGLRLHY